jgi:hypothetical protein
MGLMQSDKAFCEIVAKDRKDPMNNKFEALSHQDEWPHQWNKPVLTYKVITGTDDIRKAIDQRTAVNLMMTMWDIEGEIDFKPVYDDSPADVRIYFKSSIQESYFKTKPSTLAFAYYPGQGDVSGIIVFNDDYFFNLTGKAVNAHEVDPVNYPDPNTTQLLRGYSVIAIGGHEFGHTLGLTHSTRGLGMDLMDPYYNKHNFMPSEYDVIRFLKKYPREHYRWYSRLGLLRRWVRLRILRYHFR